MFITYDYVEKSNFYANEIISSHPPQMYLSENDLLNGCLKVNSAEVSNINNSKHTLRCAHT